MADSAHLEDCEADDAPLSKVVERRPHQCCAAGLATGTLCSDALRRENAGVHGAVFGNTSSCSPNRATSQTKRVSCGTAGTGFVSQAPCRSDQSHARLTPTPDTTAARVFTSQQRARSHAAFAVHIQWISHCTSTMPVMTMYAVVRLRSSDGLPGAFLLAMYVRIAAAVQHTWSLPPTWHENTYFNGR